MPVSLTVSGAFMIWLYILPANAWLQKIQSIPANHKLLGAQTQLDDFLFGINRQAITKARPILEEIQQGKCFYCQKALTDKTEIDHFIPFTKYANDLGHNFVAAHSSCNNSKRDHLAAVVHRERWHEQNISQHSKLIDTELSPYFNCDALRSEAVTNWAYQVAVKNNAQLWLDKSSFENVNGLYRNKWEQQDNSLFKAEENTQLAFYPNLKIACGHFKTGDDSDRQYQDAPQGFGHLQTEKHFLARASGNSMNGGKNPIQDGALLLLERITPTSAGSLQGQTVAIETQDKAGDNQYLLRVIKKTVDGRYQLLANNRDYETIYADEGMRSFARLRGIVG